ncbi:unnamed protein product [Caenorhabditis bovis]|uniref:Uncharacterized protein n=1 Tax=Caenorhabditis bovis TaxID=2654633 RepID=A0A8S1EUN1_9PELO|nr:unnamed protein product [Caenorhabditis bovis]
MSMIYRFDFSAHKELNGNFPQHVLLTGQQFNNPLLFSNLSQSVADLLTPTIDAQFRAELTLPEEFRDNLKICCFIQRNGNSVRSDASLTRMATEIVVKKYKETSMSSIAVIVIGDDPMWANVVFNDKIAKPSILTIKEDISHPSQNSTDYQAFLTHGLNIEDDFALSQQYCDVVVNTAPFSTFGWWISFLAKGKQVYYLDPAKIDVF